MKNKPNLKLSMDNIGINDPFTKRMHNLGIHYVHGTNSDCLEGLNSTKALIPANMIVENYHVMAIRDRAKRQQNEDILANNQ